MIAVAVFTWAAIDPQIWVALIGLPPALISALAAFHARRADKAVNHRVTNTTISQDVADIKVQLTQVSSDVIWLTHAFTEHLRSHVDGRNKEGDR